MPLPTLAAALRGPVQRIPVLDRLVIGDVLKTLLGVFSVLVIIVASQKFIGILESAIEGKVPARLVFALLGLKTLQVAILVLPTTLFMSVLVVLGRMYRDHEMTALASAGAGVPRIYRSLLWLLLPLTVATAWLAFDVLRWVAGTSDQLKQISRQEYDLRGIQPGRFHDFNDGKLVFFVERLGAGWKLQRIFVQNNEGGDLSIVTADRGHFEVSDNGDQYLVLEDGTRIEGRAGTRDYSRFAFQEYAVRIRRNESASSDDSRSRISTGKLLAEGTPRDIAEFHKRLAIPAGVVLLAVLAVPMARSAPRSGFYGNLISAFLIYVTYENLQRVTQGLMIKGQMPAWVGFSWVYGLILIVTLLLLARQQELRLWRRTGSRAP